MSTIPLTPSACASIEALTKRTQVKNDLSTTQANLLSIVLQHLLNNRKHSIMQYFKIE
jgi:hypothetical protein